MDFLPGELRPFTFNKITKSSDLGRVNHIFVSNGIHTDNSWLVIREQCPLLTKYCMVNLYTFLSVIFLRKCSDRNCSKIDYKRKERRNSLDMEIQKEEEKAQEMRIECQKTNKNRLSYLLMDKCPPSTVVFKTIRPPML